MSDIESAKNVHVENCEPECPCQAVHVVLWDDSAPFAAASFSPEQARGLARDIIEAADLAEAQLLKQRGRIG